MHNFLLVSCMLNCASRKLLSNIFCFISSYIKLGPTHHQSGVFELLRTSDCDVICIAPQNCWNSTTEIKQQISTNYKIMRYRKLFYFIFSDCTLACNFQLCIPKRHSKLCCTAWLIWLIYVYLDFPRAFRCFTYSKIRAQCHSGRCCAHCAISISYRC